MSLHAVRRVALANRSKNEGFTLIEVLTALVIMSIATSIFIGLYTGSLSLAKTSQLHKTAVLVAEEGLNELRNNPGAYKWPTFDDASDHSFKSIPAADGGTAINPVEPPAAMPNTQRAYDRTRDFYHEFTWEGFARRTSETANHVEVLIVVSWEFKGRVQQFHLTSAMPLVAREGAGS